MKVRELPGTVVVTGAAGGIGQAVVSRLRTAGCRVVGWDVADLDANWSQRVDLSSIPDIRSACDELLASYEVGAGLGVVHCAGVQLSGNVGSLGSAEWLSSMHVNVQSIDTLVGRVLRVPDAARDLSAVVCVGSVHVRASTANALPYAVTKHALWGWVRSAALELAGSGIRVNMVSPGAVDTEMLRDGLASRDQDGTNVNELIDELASRTPLGRIGSPDDVASAVQFLLSDSARFSTGSDLVLDGGVLAQLSSEGSGRTSNAKSV